MSPIHAKQVLAATFEKALAARPPRLTLQSPVRYRTKGLGHWHEGIVENLSHSGILLSGPQQLTEHTLVEMVLCQGRIIRHTEVCELEFMGMAASILDYKILPPRAAKA